MPAISTTPSAIDRKLHRIVLDTDPDNIKSFAALGRQIAASKPVEFSYQRYGKVEYAGANAIEAYVSFARDIGLLDGDLRITRPKKEVRPLENFQHWLGDLTLQYLEGNNASLNQIEQAIISLSNKTPCRLPTQDSIRSHLDIPVSLRNFRFALKIIALLRTNVLTLVSCRVLLMDGVNEI